MKEDRGGYLVKELIGMMQNSASSEMSKEVC